MLLQKTHMVTTIFLLQRWVPTTSVGEYSATLAKWYGISSPTDLATVLPNIGRFANPDVGFMNALPPPA
jgi:uncharacterized protein (DUF1501 family)